MTSLEVHVQRSAHLRDEVLRRGVELALRGYDEQVTHGVVRLQRQQEDPARFECCIDLGVRWWGRLSVQEEAPDPQQAVDRALAGLSRNLEAFLLD
jgi:hypothetical protein